MKCSECQFYRVVEGADPDYPYGLCRIYPPDAGVGFPYVGCADWCGEFEAVESAVAADVPGSIGSRVLTAISPIAVGILAVGGIIFFMQVLYDFSTR